MMKKVVLVTGASSGIGLSIANYLHFQAFRNMNVGYASAIGAMMFIYVFIVITIFGILRRLDWEI